MEDIETSVSDNILSSEIDNETTARRKIDQLCFRHRRFNEMDIISFAQKYGFQAALAVMNDCVEDNRKREKRKLQPLNYGSMFKQKMRKYNHREQEDQTAKEWMDYTETIVAQQSAGFKATYDQIEGTLDDALDAGYISHEQYDKGKNFLRLMTDMDKVQEPEETETTEEKEETNAQLAE